MTIETIVAHQALTACLKMMNQLNGLGRTTNQVAPRQVVAPHRVAQAHQVVAPHQVVQAHQAVARHQVARAHQAQ